MYELYKIRNRNVQIKLGLVYKNLLVVIDK